MYITWEDRKGRGRIDNEQLTTKPPMSFGYAWFLVSGDTAQYVESHDAGVYNKDLTAEQLAEITDFYAAYPSEPDKPAHNPKTHKLVENGTDVTNGKTYKHYDVVPLSAEELAGIAKKEAKDAAKVKSKGKSWADLTPGERGEILAHIAEDLGYL